ncbi:TusE/DsrC/DsvC family sulfur relay protein [Candidatus Pantoea carbekii]|uniref:Sulfurtransferase n=1 Tax=Candidatus Pantoea carbekii TaxID=1235990 RepID=U3U8J7_9GAMM|nr:TusE/DsrC/DsvC family sulfur relay protein [Candidatus Pantoea carbekii]AKC32147.1 sulfite reductase YccK [Candidatus Pantoea carbekii]BAO00674.1 putative anaerobic sulfite reductase gamma subunit [Candidatus Pantoea carbekii]
MISGDKEIFFDTEGYLKNSADWTETVAQFIAETQENMLISEAHWEIIYFIREFYEKFNTSPTVRMLVKYLEKKHGQEKGSSKYLFRLFPKGPAKQAVKIAGLPRTVRCL